MPEIQQFGFTYIIHFYLFGIFYSPDMRAELRDKLNMTYALQAESERADVCKNTQRAEGRLRGWGQRARGRKKNDTKRESRTDWCSAEFEDQWQPCGGKHRGQRACVCVCACWLIRTACFFGLSGVGMCTWVCVQERVSRFALPPSSHCRRENPQSLGGCRKSDVNRE